MNDGAKYIKSYKVSSTVIHQVQELIILTSMLNGMSLFPAVNLRRLRKQEMQFYDKVESTRPSAKTRQ